MATWLAIILWSTVLVGVGVFLANHIAEERARRAKEMRQAEMDEEFDRQQKQFAVRKAHNDRIRASRKELHDRLVSKTPIADMVQTYYQDGGNDLEGEK